MTRKQLSGGFCLVRNVNTNLKSMTCTYDKISSWALLKGIIGFRKGLESFDSDFLSHQRVSEAYFSQ